MVSSIVSFLFVFHDLYMNSIKEQNASHIIVYQRFAWHRSLRIVFVFLDRHMLLVFLNDLLSVHTTIRGRSEHDDPNFQCRFGSESKDSCHAIPYVINCIAVMRISEAQFSSLIRYSKMSIEKGVKYSIEMEIFQHVLLYTCAMFYNNHGQ